MADLNKICAGCKIAKPKLEFYKSRFCKDGCRSKCKLCLSSLGKKYHNKNKDKINKRKSKYNKENRDKINKRRREYRKNRISLKTKITERLRKSLGKALSRDSKAESTKELLGCTIEFFKEYIESKFTNGMSWENYGYYTWHLDHIIPIASFDLKNIEDQKKCFHYTNFQPLWSTTKVAIENGESEDYIGNIEKKDKLLQKDKDG